MIRSIRSISAVCSVWIPGLKGPAELFSPDCIQPEHWQSIYRYFERRLRWDLPAAPADFIEEGVQGAVVHLYTTPPEVWARLKIGYGDRWRAILAAAGYARRRGWRWGGGHRQDVRKIRPYPTSGKNGLPGPVAVAMAVEAAAAGVKGKRAGQGVRKPTVETLAADEVRIAMVGYPREAKLAAVSVGGGTAQVQSSGTMREVEVSRVAYSFHGGKRVGGRWIPDGKVWQEEEVTTAYRMVRSCTRPTVFEPCEVFDSAEW